MNKLISVFFLLVLVGFILWLLITKTTTVKNFFTSKFPVIGLVATNEPKPTTNKDKARSSGLLSGIKQDFKKDNTNNPTPKISPLGDENKSPQQPKPNITTYPKTGGETMLLLPLVAIVYASGKFLKKIAR